MAKVLTITGRKIKVGQWRELSPKKYVTFYDWRPYTQEMINDDMALLRKYAQGNSEEAFAALVSRHVHLVYSVAIRQVRDAQLAEEITQATFIILARKAKSLGEKTVLSGWLCRTARFVSNDALKMQRRRQLREQEAYMQSLMNESRPEEWMQIAPLLDPALAQLSEKDHNAIVLRFMENKSLSEVGLALGTSEDAAKMRVNRALEKLRIFLLKRGLTISGVMIAGAISTHSVQAAPAALTKSATSIALAKGATASGSTLILINGALKIMAWTKAKTAAVVGVVIILAAGSTITLEKNQESHTRMEQVRKLDMAFLLYANAHGGQLPNDFQWLLANASDDPHAFSNGSVTNWEIVSGGNLNNFTNLGQTVLLREREPRHGVRGRFIRAYAFADGHVDQLYSPDKDFADVEKKRGLLVHREEH